MTDPEGIDPPADGVIPARQLADAAMTGARWVVVARVAGEVLAFAAAIALARLIAPAEFGRAAVAMALVPLAAILTFEGCASALVQRPTLDRAQRESASFLSLATGVVLTAIAFAAAPLAAPVFGERTAELLRLVSPVFVLAAPGCVPRALLWRELRFRTLSVVEVAGLLGGAATSVALAAGGLGGEAIVGGGLAMTAVTSLGLCLNTPLVPPRLHRAAARDIGSFGAPAALAGMLHVGFANVDYVVMAARLSATQAGLYWRAFQLGVSYQEKVSGILLRLAYPVYSRAGSLEEVRRLHARATRLHATLVLPLLAFIVASAPVLVPWLFGPAWAGAALPAQILAVAGMVSAVLTGYPQVMLAVGRPRALLRFNAGMLVVYGGVVTVAAGFGLVAACVAAVVAHVAIFAAVYGLLLGPHVGVPVRRSLLDVAPALVAAAAAVAAALPLRVALEPAIPSTAVLAAVGAVTVGVYALTVRALFPAAWTDVARLASRMLPRRRPRPAVSPSPAGGA